jgi:hypothetical protein
MARIQRESRPGSKMGAALLQRERHAEFDEYGGSQTKSPADCSAGL